jgi:hypothetical protein
MEVSPMNPHSDHTAEDLLLYTFWNNKDSYVNLNNEKQHEYHYLLDD